MVLELTKTGLYVSDETKRIACSPSEIAYVQWHFPEPVFKRRPGFDDLAARLVHFGVESEDEWVGVPYLMLAGSVSLDSSVVEPENLQRGLIRNVAELIHPQFGGAQSNLPNSSVERIESVLAQAYKRSLTRGIDFLGSTLSSMERKGYVTLPSKTTGETVVFPTSKLVQKLLK